MELITLEAHSKETQDIQIKALYQGQWQEVKQMLEAKQLDINQVFYLFQRRPLHYLVMSPLNNDLLASLLQSDTYRKVILLDAQDRKGCTALHHAADRRNLEAYELLIKAGANSHIVNHDGIKPLDIVRRKETYCIQRIENLTAYYHNYNNAIMGTQSSTSDLILNQKTPTKLESNYNFDDSKKQSSTFPKEIKHSIKHLPKLRFLYRKTHKDHQLHNGEEKLAQENETKTAKRRSYS